VPFHQYRNLILTTGYAQCIPWPLCGATAAFVCSDGVYSLHAVMRLNLSSPLSKRSRQCTYLRPFSVLFLHISVLLVQVPLFSPASRNSLSIHRSLMHPNCRLCFAQHCDNIRASWLHPSSYTAHQHPAMVLKTSKKRFLVELSLIGSTVSKSMSEPSQVHMLVF
jgi:hypothetical protein